jgi:hypothetical protein
MKKSLEKLSIPDSATRIYKAIKEKCNLWKNN